MSKHTLISLIVVIAALAFLDPLMLLMPAFLVYATLAGLLVSSIFYALVIFRERVLDEREVMIRAFVDRVVGLVGTCLLVLVICYQVLVLHAVDAAVIGVLVLMVLTKQIVYWYAERHW